MLDVRILPVRESKLKMVYQAPFESVHQAIKRYKLNPARAKYINFFEPERFGSTYHAELSDRHPDRLWARILLGLCAVLRGHSHEKRVIWWLVRIDDSDPERHLKDVARAAGKHHTTIYRWLDKIDDEIKEEFIRRKLIPDPNEEARNGNP